MIEEPKKKLNLFERILCFMGGARLSILDQCSHEKNKFIAIGIGVVNTALLSMLTMGYAINNITGAKENVSLYTIPIAFLWGLIIFGIDWGLITTMKKQDPEDPNFKNRHWFRNWSSRYLNLAFYFRLAIAIIIAYTIAKPLEVMIFEPYLPPYRAMLKEQSKQELNQMAESRYINLEKERNTLQGDINDLRAASAEFIDNNPIVIRDRASLQEINNNIQALVQANNADRTRINNLGSKKEVAAYQNQLDALKNELEQEDIDEHRIDEINQEVGQLEQTIRENQEFNNEIDRRAAPFRANIRNRNQQLANLRNERDDISQSLTFTEDSLYRVNQSEIADLQTRRDSLDSWIQAEGTVVDTRRGVIEEISDALEKNTFVANLITIGQIEKFRHMEDVDEDSRQLGRKVYQIGLLITLILIVAETAPLLIKYLSPFGEYELLLENKSREARERNNVNYVINKAIGRSEVRINSSLIDRLSRAQEKLIDEAIDLWKKQQKPEKMFTNEQNE